jgi:hypothetical protein
MRFFNKFLSLFRAPESGPAFTIDEIEMFGSLADLCDRTAKDETMCGLVLSPAVCRHLAEPLRRIGVPRKLGTHRGAMELVKDVYK